MIFAPVVFMLVVFMPVVFVPKCPMYPNVTVSVYKKLVGYKKAFMNKDFSKRISKIQDSKHQ